MIKNKKTKILIILVFCTILISGCRSELYKSIKRENPSWNEVNIDRAINLHKTYPDLDSDSIEFIVNKDYHDEEIIRFLKLTKKYNNWSKETVEKAISLKEKHPDWSKKEIEIAVENPNWSNEKVEREAIVANHPEWDTHPIWTQETKDLAISLAMKNPEWSDKKIEIAAENPSMSEQTIKKNNCITKETSRLV